MRYAHATKRAGSIDNPYFDPCLHSPTSSSDSCKVFNLPDTSSGSSISTDVPSSSAGKVSLKESNVNYNNILYHLSKIYWNEDSPKHGKHFGVPEVFNLGEKGCQNEHSP